MSTCSKLFALFTTVTLFTSNQIFAQCPITVSAGPDKYVCNSGGSVTLDGSITGQEIAFRWTPATGLSSTTVLNPTATVTGTATYTLTAAAEDPTAPNLVTNPGFESGNTGFSSGYTYNPTPITPGTYVLTTSPSLVLSTFPPCDDHTFGNGTGNLMLVNGNGSANSQVWCQTIPVMPNSWYIMGAWTTVSPISPPVFQFTVNNVPAGPSFTPPNSGCLWQEFTSAWFSGAATSATLCIKDISGSGNGLFGDDYGLDDIYFKKACSVSDMVNVSVVTVNAVLPANITLNCNALETGIVLNGSASSTGTGFTYNWDGPGIISGGNTPNATVNEPGQYTLTVSFDTGDGICTDEATINVLPDPNTVTAVANTNGPLSCTVLTTTLSGAGSTTGPLITYDWQPSAGIVSGGNTLNPVVNQAGQYTLTVSRTGSGCTATAVTDVQLNTTSVTAITTSPVFLPCTGGTRTLDGMGSSTGSGYSYQWSGPGIISGANTLNNCMINAPGVYVLTVTHTPSGCTATSSVNIIQSGTAPNIAVAASAPGALNCVTDTLTINSNGSSTGTDYIYQWSTSGGHIIGPVNGQSIQVDTAGTYTLVITYTINGCTSISSVNIGNDLTAPTISLATVPSIICTTDSLQINASGSSSGAGLQYQWNSPNGVILSGDTTLTPWVAAAGNYILSITNLNNGCTSDSTVVVMADTVAPVAVANLALPGVLNCITNSIQLTSTGSSNDTTTLFNWTTIDGHFIGSTSDSTAAADSTGTYILLVTNSLNGCTKSDSIVLSADFEKPVVAIFQSGAGLDCTIESVQINAGASSSGPEFSYQWSTMNGQILSGDTTLMLWVGSAGNYTLNITDNSNGCTSSGSLFVLEDTIRPVVVLANPPELNCGILQTTINASGSFGGANLIPNWTYTPAPGASGPGIVSGQNTLMPSADAPGVYTLTLVNADNNCQDIDSVTVIQDLAPPVAEAGTAPAVDCSAQIALLDGSGSSQGLGYTYLWTGGATTLQTQVNTPGTYFLTVTNSDNQCIAVDSVTLQPFGGVPSVAIDVPAMLTCASAQTNLSATASSGPAFSYQWVFSGSGSGILIGDTTLTPTIGSAGDYTLTVLNTQTGCTNTATVTVSQSADVPVADAGAVQTLLCGVTQLSLDGSLSSTGPNYTYLWNTLNGNVLSGQNTLNPLVNQAGLYTLVVTDTLNGCTSTDNVQVQLDANVPTADAGSAGVLTCLTTTLNLDGSNSSTGAGILYEWTTPDGVIANGATTISPEITAPGTYFITVTNTNNNCTASASVTITEMKQPPTAAAASVQLLTCSQTQVPLDGTGSSTGPGISYLWSGPGITGGSTSISAIAGTPGTYTLTVTDNANGCTSSATTMIQENKTPPSAAAGAVQNLTCTQLQVNLSGTGSSTGANITYHWSGPGISIDSTSLSPSVNAAGVYTLIVTNTSNGCTATASTNVISDTAPPVAIANASQAITCIQQQVNVDGTGSSTGPDFVYLWTGPGISGTNNTLITNVISAGNYMLLVTDQSNGCTNAATVAVITDTIAPVADIATPLLLTCTVTTLELDGTGSSYTPDCMFMWGGPGILSGGNTLMPVISASGNFTLTITDASNGCSDIAQVNVNQNTIPPVANAGPNGLFDCKMSPVTLNGSSNIPGAQFSWSTANGQIASGANSPQPTVSLPGTYTLMVTDPFNGCTATSSSTVAPNEVIFPEPAIELPDCTDSTGTVTFSGGQGEFSYSIDGGLSFGADPLFPGLTAGNYISIVKEAGGCLDTVAVDIPVVIKTTVTLDSILSIVAGSNIQLNPQVSTDPGQIASILWSPSDGLSCTDCLDPVAQPGSDITYKVLITNTDGCTASAQVLLLVSSETGNVYVPNTFSPESEGENNQFRVFTDAVVGQFTMQVFDRWGSSLFITNNISEGWDGRSRGKLLNPGIYVYYVNIELLKPNGEKETRLIKGDVLLNR